MYITIVEFTTSHKSINYFQDDLRKNITRTTTCKYAD